MWILLEVIYPKGCSLAWFLLLIKHDESIGIYKSAA